MFRVDEFGFYIYWKSEGREGDVLDLSQVGQAISLMKMFFDPHIHNIMKKGIVKLKYVEKR